MKLLHRTIFGEVLRVFTLVLAGITVVLMFVVVFKYAGEMGMGPLQIISIMPYAVPSLLPFTIPATLLMTVCVVYGRVSGDLEMTAAKAAGINPMSLLTPTIIFGVFLSGISFILTDQVIPWAFRKITVAGVEAVEDIFLTQLRSDGKFHHPQTGFDIIVQRVEGKRLIMPIFRMTGKDGRDSVLQAREATFHFDVPNREMYVDIEAGHGEMSDGTSFDMLCPNRIDLPWFSSFSVPNAREISITKIDEELAEKAENRIVESTKHDLLAAMSMTTGQFPLLASEAQSAAIFEYGGDRRANKLRTERASRYALSCSCLFFALLGSPFALLRGQTQFLTSFLYCFLPIVGAYYPLMLGIMSQAKSGDIDPTYAVWIGNAGLFLLGCHTIRKLCRH